MNTGHRLVERQGHVPGDPRVVETHARAREREGDSPVFTTKDPRAGMRRFAETGRPVFTGD